MKLLLLICLLPVQLFAANYYLSAKGNDNADGTSPATAWRSITRLNASFSNIKPGDSILFKRDDVFYGSIAVKQSGTKDAPIVISAYGEGNMPVITGFTTVTKWQTKANGIWEAPVPNADSSVNLVIKNNLIQQVGRYPNRDTPNGGYLIYSAVDGSVKASEMASITSAVPLTQNWKGAELVIKKRRWNIERDTVLSQNGNIISYRQPFDGNIYPGIEGFGFFFQRHPSTLDQPGEWYFDPAEKKLQMFFGVGTPFTERIKISTVDTLVNIGRNAWITVAGLSFEGANQAAIYSYFTRGCTVTGCEFNFMGKDGVTLWQTADAVVDYCTVTNALASGIFIRNSGGGGFNNSTVQYCKVKNICQFPGMETEGDALGRAGITVVGGSNVLVQFNTVDSTGYGGIEWQGNDVLVYSNVITNCMTVRDDCGGIYSYVGKGPSPKQYRNRIVRRNIVLNSIGTTEGTDEKRPKARGIYCDDGSNHVLIDSNSIAHCSGAALYANSVTAITMRNNIVFDNELAFSIQRFQHASSIRNITITHNWFFPYVAAYANAQIDQPALTLEEDLKAVGTIDSNYFSSGPARPFSFTTLKTGNKEYKTFTKTFDYWKYEVGFDKRSKHRAGVNDKVRFVYNASAETIVVPLYGRYKDPEGNLFENEIILQPYRAWILIGGRQ